MKYIGLSGIEWKIKGLDGNKIILNYDDLDLKKDHIIGDDDPEFSYFLIIIGIRGVDCPYKIILVENVPDRIISKYNKYKEENKLGPAYDNIMLKKREG
jgi:hypothetical protein